MSECPLCGQPTYKASTRLIKDACGHTKCRLCLLQEEYGCSICKGEQIKKIQNRNAIANFERPSCESYNNPLELVHKIPDKSKHISCLSISQTGIIKKGNLKNVQKKKYKEIQNKSDNIEGNNGIFNKTIEKEIENKEEEMDNNKNITENINEQKMEKEAFIPSTTEPLSFLVHNVNKFQGNNYQLVESEISTTENVIIIDSIEEGQIEKLNYNDLNKTPNHFINNRSPDFRLSDYLSFKSRGEKIAYNESITSPIHLLGYHSPEFQLSDYVLFKNKSVTEKNIIEMIEENKTDKSDNNQPNITSLPFVINLDSNNLCHSSSPLTDKRILIDKDTVNKEQNKDERVNYDHLKCYEFPSYSVLEKKLRNNDNLADKLESSYKKEKDTNQFSSIHIEYTNKSFLNLEGSICPTSEKILKTPNCDKTEIKKKEKVKDDENKENKEMCNEKKELAVNTKEGCNSELVSISIVKHRTCKAKNKAQEDIKIDTNDNQTNSSTRLKRKKRKEQNKKSDKQITIRKGKRKRKPKVLFYEDNYETDTKGPSPKRRRRGKDWSHIVTLPGSTVTYKCTFCEKMFKSPRGKWYHTSCPSGEAPFRCHLCARTFAKRSHFEYHERMHSGHKPFACNFCDKSFVQKSKLNRHLLIHKQQNDIECAECGRRFSTKQYLKNHMSIHQNNSYKCKFCPKTFTLAFNRKRHERSHSTDRPYKCDICSKDFKGKFLLTRHRRTHDKNRPFSCHDCHRVFLSKFEVQRHMSVHSDVKPYSCNQCNLEFRRKDNLNRHVKHHHVLDSDTLKTVENDFKEQANNTERIVNGNANEKLSNQEERSIEEKSSKFKNNIEKPTNNLKTKPKQKRTSRSNSISSTKSILKTSLCSPQPHRQAGSKPDLSNAVPVIRGPISIKRFAEGSEIMGTRLGFTQSISPEEAVVLNRQIEEKIYTQDSFCIYPGLNRRANSIVRRTDSCGSNSNSNDDTSFACKQNPEKSKTVHFAKEEQCEVLRTDEPKVVKDINLHWRRRTAESLKTKISKSKQT